MVLTWCVFNCSRTVAQEVCRPASSSVFSIAVSRSHLGEEAIEFRVTGGACELLLSAKRGLEFVGQGEPVLSGAGAEVAERADDFLTRTLGREDTFDEEIVGVGFAFVGPRGFADIHILDTN